jgi:hypothetical protein
MLPHLLHGEETRVWGNQAYHGQAEVLREHAPHAQDFTHQRYRCKDRIDEIERAKNRTKSGVWSKGRTCLCRAQTQVWIRQGALSRNGQECEPPVCYLRAGESVPGAQATIVRYGGVVPQEAAEPPFRGHKANGIPGGESQATGYPRLCPSLGRED